MKKLQETDNNYRNCPLCGSSERTILSKVAVICNNCSLVYNSQKPHSTEDHWTNFTFNPKTHHYDLQRVKFFKSLWKYIVKITKKNKGCVLDVGCGPAIILKIASENGWVAEGIEISDEIADFAQKYSNCKIYVGDIQSLDFINKYDLILMIDTLRHLEDPLKILNKCYKLLKNDGFIIIRELNADNFLNKKRIRLNYPYDLQFLSKETAQKLFKKVCFKKAYVCPSPMSFLTIPIVKKLPRFLQKIIMILINDFIKFLYLITGKIIIITPEVLFIAQK